MMNSNRWLPGFLVGLSHEDERTTALRRCTGAALVMAGLIIVWFTDYAFSVLPFLRHLEERLAREEKMLDSDKYMILNARTMVIFVLWYCLSQAVRWLSYISACRNRGLISRLPPYTACGVRLIVRDGPFYLHGMFICMFVGLLVSHKGHHQGEGDEQATMIVFVCSNITVLAGAHFFQFWCERIMMDVGSSSPPPSASAKQGVPSDIIKRLETCTYDGKFFEDVESKLYPSVCAICLSEWEPMAAIKVMPCQHVFHEECIEQWLKLSKTCAVCRADIVEAMQLHCSEVDSQAADAAISI
eukprot:CAMPEP_0172662612 /NCGR_PEP_ID=MMETSP1074-20121228/5454_1 /TAXON_ID=2916 /ORGANISM="Ceratium fusus, Strain PA161109" /LENGTH=299 /DNA_ID=CAMNT_0013478539 /DNA_START=49 /DNA_END=948 /DNA_ORIENTATION=+